MTLSLLRLLVCRGALDDPIELLLRPVVLRWERSLKAVDAAGDCSIHGPASFAEGRSDPTVTKVTISKAQIRGGSASDGEIMILCVGGLYSARTAWQGLSDWNRGRSFRGPFAGWLANA